MQIHAAFSTIRYPATFLLLSYKLDHMQYIYSFEFMQNMRQSIINDLNLQFNIICKNRMQANPKQDRNTCMH